MRARYRVYKVSSLWAIRASRIHPFTKSFSIVGYCDSWKDAMTMALQMAYQDTSIKF